ncbi:DUF5610 domain-containing protein [Herbaspirillum rubrisubalbicans]|uniref:DUF5610 domain-containing protein n=1 Tax=Herbaspirillum rubrisubalbicans TaxID=80842 RepID=A0AAD0UCK2_9BURK|nr:DUF5610 domain-containing protein [Herbaspirillum rubrisubalbicans]ALU91270.1 hypothetical protein Hrubri_4121 [Herbaspirillum rubrisubalbicans M1]AYR26296.1 hypothetical protein RC54_21835 [Herbaspirillum rubrisubalbicans]
MAIGNTSGVDTKSLLPSTTTSTSNSNATGDTDKLPANTADAAGGDKIADARKANLLTVSGAKTQFNLSIVQSSLEVSLQTQNDPLSLVYKTAIENINDILRPQLGDNAVQAASSQDNSPEATAGRIVSFITNMFELYKKNNPDKEDASNVDDYMNLIFKGVDQGFKEARGILESLQVLQGDIASNIDKTYDLVQKSLNDFINKVKGGKPEGGDGEGSTDNGDGQGGTLVASETTVSISVSVSQTRISTTA